jgi:hypothetical protein
VFVVFGLPETFKQHCLEPSGVPETNLQHCLELSGKYYRAQQFDPLSEIREIILRKKHTSHPNGMRIPDEEHTVLHLKLSFMYGNFLMEFRY